MIWKLALLFTVVPTVELILLIFIGTQIGVLWTTAIVLVTGFTGAWLAKREGSGMLRKLRADLKRGLPPAARIAEGVMVLVGGLLLVTPGVMTDIVGFAMILPFTRRLLAPVLLRFILRQVTGDDTLADQVELRFDDDEEDPTPPPSGPKPGPFDHPVA
ncbi:MAG: FxsA family protein [Deltaproteobacteria bacterium]|nr:MAG: FxsA family protein [Deltaproteobacteria bacterium]